MKPPRPSDRKAMIARHLNATKLPSRLGHCAVVFVAESALRAIIRTFTEISKPSMRSSRTSNRRGSKRFIAWATSWLRPEPARVH